MAKHKEPLNTDSFNRLVRKLVNAEVEVANRPGDTDAVRKRTKARKKYHEALGMVLPPPLARCVSVSVPSTQS